MTDETNSKTASVDEVLDKGEYKYGFMTDIETDTLPKGLNENLLGKFLRFGVIAQPAQRGGEDIPLVLFDQQAESVAITLLRSADQFGESEFDLGGVYFKDVHDSISCVWTNRAFKRPVGPKGDDRGGQQTEPIRRGVGLANALPS